MSVKILAFAGSARKGSYTKQLAKVAADAAQEAGAVVTLIDFADYPLPLFDEDLERAGTPENATKLKTLFLDHDALLIVTPEYNSSLPPLLKNVIDWVSRQAAGESPLAAYQGKTATIFAASPGALGGLRVLVHLRSILSNIGVTVLPGQFALAAAHEELDDGKLKNPKNQQRVAALAAELVRVSGQLKE
ncbi:NADPH-dependent FMN reductase [Aureliella helgolandensis]|uniref:FMN-dependent NADPH-azoreductase n=1 Tax=Aureliella helgolandensis TaxID=2527968 RepID=A0A518G5U3_9BACT|nr:NAD(P)H-dependent oxidoreductase [Aureliella helgolandensis]QDV23962.1 FMN-dependent NADPH-azoreductase [Aureliella helgolandensis]